jgi:hypothetical protein
LVVGREPAFFYDCCRPPVNHSSSTGETVSFGRVFATLIRAGHNPDRLAHYTYRQLMLYYREALSLANQDSITRILDAYAGSAGGQSANTRINALKK